MSQAFSAPRQADRQSQIDRLTECDENLSRIATDVTGLSNELAQLRAEGKEMAGLLAERDGMLEKQRLALSTLEEEHALSRQQAEAATSARRMAESRLAQQGEQVATLQRELHALRTGLEGRERRLVDAEAALSEARGALAESTQALAQERTVARNSEQTIADWQRRSADLQLELAEAVADRARLESALAELRSDERGADRSGTSVADEPIPGHLRFIAVPGGYRLEVSEEPCPRPRDHLDVEGQPFVVARTGLSPLPSDKRRCAFLLPDRE